MLRALLFFLLTQQPLYCEVSHYKNIIVGDRAAGMAGAYTAISDDTSGAFYNPAGIVYSEEATGLSATVNVYHLQASKYKNAIRDRDWDRKSTELLPNFFGILKNWGKHALEFSIIIPDSFVQHQDQVFNDLPSTGIEPAIDRYVFNLHTEDVSYLIGPSYAFKLNDSLSMGTTLSFFYRKNRMQIYQTIWFPDNTYTNSSIVTEWGERGFSPKAGIRWSILKNLHLGFVIGHTFIASSDFRAQTSLKKRDKNLADFDELTSKTRRNTPTQFSLGLAYKPIPSFLISGDIELYTSANADSFYPYGYNTTINASIGAEYAISKKHVARIGFFTNRTNMPKPSEQTRQITYVNIYGFSTGYTIHLETTSITLGLIYSAGSGEAQVYENSSRIISVRRYSLSCLLATSFKF